MANVRCYKKLNQMQTNSPVGEIEKGGQPTWAFDLLGTTVFWLGKAEELDRMVKMGFDAWLEDVQTIREYVNSDGKGELKHPPRTLTVSFFLASLAIENLLKAVLVREHPEYIQGGKFRGKFISSHNLMDIARDAAIELTNDEQDLCELGTECILSFGRYHTGKSVSDSPSKITVKQTAFAIYEDLFNRLHRDVLSNPYPLRTEQSGGDGRS